MDAQEERYLNTVLSKLPQELKAEIRSTGGGFYSVTVDFGTYTLDIPCECGGLYLLDTDGSTIAALSKESSPTKLAKLVTDLYELNFGHKLSKVKETI